VLGQPAHRQPQSRLSESNPRERGMKLGQLDNMGGVCWICRAESQTQSLARSVGIWIECRQPGETMHRSPR
jgi:hypothetical protein